MQYLYLCSSVLKNQYNGEQSLFGSGRFFKWVEYDIKYWIFIVHYLSTVSYDVLVFSIYIFLLMFLYYYKR